MSSGVNTIGFKEFQSKLKALPSEVKTISGAYVQDAGLKWEQLAKRSAPVDKGILRNNITSRKVTPMTVEITSGALYSPYVEWGTGTRVSVPSELQAYAIQFRGVKKVIGRYPKPYFFIHKEAVRNELYGKLNKLVNTTR